MKHTSVIVDGLFAEVVSTNPLKRTCEIKVNASEILTVYQSNTKPTDIPVGRVLHFVSQVMPDAKVIQMVEAVTSAGIVKGSLDLIELLKQYKEKRKKVLV